MNSNGTRNFGEQKEYLRLFNVSILASVLLALLVLAAVSALQAVGQPRIWFLLIIALGALGLGALSGFLFSTFGDEKERFSQTMNVLNGFIGGFAIADLSKSDSIVRRFFQGVASSIGLPGCGGLVLLVMSLFGAIGFLALYVNKKVLLNPITSMSDKLIDARREVLGDSGLSTTEPGGTPKPSGPTTSKAVETILKAPSPGGDASPESQKAYAKALFFKGELSKASDALDVLLRQVPNDTDALLDKAQVLLSDNRPLEAIPILEKLARLPKSPLVTWKLLGYAYLFDETRLGDALQATERYLQLRPDDPGALLNLACVFGQRGPDDDEARRRLPLILDSLFAKDPHARRRVLQLATQGQDFEAWRGVPFFQKLTGSLAKGQPDQATPKLG